MARDEMRLPAEDDPASRADQSTEALRHRFGDAEIIGDLLVEQARIHPFEHLELGWRQVRKDRLGGGHGLEMGRSVHRRSSSPGRARAASRGSGSNRYASQPYENRLDRFKPDKRII